MNCTESEEHSLLQRAFGKTCDIFNESVEYGASLSIGQAILRQTDRLLWTVEKCCEWSVPSSSSSKSNTSNGTFGKPNPLIRPLPWIIFLPMLVSLRIIRLFLNIIALSIGLETVKPITLVRFIQVRRRKIRALRFLGMRRIRHRKMFASSMTLRERFYNIISRAMCFKVTNTDLYEEITVKASEEEKSQNKPKVVSGKDLKRKYIEILRTNSLDWEDVEDDEELIERITLLAEDDITIDPNYEPSDDSATEEDSMSDAEEDAISAHSSPKPNLQRPSSYGSITNEIIEEENEDSDSTVSCNSADESSQHLNNTEEGPKIETKKDEKQYLDPVLTSDEFYSPINSIPASPEPKEDNDVIKKSNQNKIEDKIETEKSENNEKTQDDSKRKLETATSQKIEKTNLELAPTSEEIYSTVNNISSTTELKQDSEVFTHNNQNLATKLDSKLETQKLINNENIQVTVPTKNTENSSLPANCSPPITASGTKNGVGAKSKSPLNSRGKKHKHKRRFANLLRRKRK